MNLALKFGVNVSLICLCTWSVRWNLYNKKLWGFGFKIHIFRYMCSLI
jgi:hypothetical protein